MRPSGPWVILVGTCAGVWGARHGLTTRQAVHRPVLEKKSYFLILF